MAGEPPTEEDQEEREKHIVDLVVGEEGTLVLGRGLSRAAEAAGKLYVQAAEAALLAPGARVGRRVRSVQARPGRAINLAAAGLPLEPRLELVQGRLELLG